MYCETLTVVLATLLCLVSAASFTNPLKMTNGADPFIATTGGFYYLTTTTQLDIQITRATTLEGLKTATPKVVWTDSTPSRCCHIWSPELWFIDGIWYIYYTAGENVHADFNAQRPHVLKGGADIWNDSYSYLGQLSDKWGIDGTVIRFNSPWESSYFVWVCNSGNLDSVLCIAPFTSPSTIGASSVISRPTESWEKVGWPINEAPAALYHDGKTFLTFSASDCASVSYSLGLLTWDGQNDPTKITSWTKSTGPVFSSANGNYGTGHNGFFTSFDGTQIWNVFHAVSNSSGACDITRHTMADIVNWNPDGSPNFGAATALSTILTGPSGEAV